MIIVKLIGGLGNQMFQYAAGRRLAQHHNTDLILDVTGFASYSLRKYELDIFRINATIATQDLLKRVEPFSRKDFFRLGIRSLFLGETKIESIREQTLDFDGRVLSLPDNIYLDGYWQNEKYFVDISDIIKKEFTFATSPPAINKGILEEIRGCNSVSVHIRRGDYISNPKTWETHGVLGIEYYIQALNLIEKKVINPQIFIFSDDIPWVKDNLKTGLALHFMEQSGEEKNYEDLRLMSNCKHHIIANSSFSWWGAWLSSNQNKVVIAPIKWFSDEKMNGEQKIVPLNWIKI
ncbi:MAG: alpha-1,2-fucosyltransferase [Methanoregula sp.]|jgi:hypothetical protein